MSKPRIVILGSGPSGLGAAFRLVQDGKADVTLLEQSNAVGGNAGSFELSGVMCDYGSHRLHPSTPPDVLADIQRLLGDDLLVRPRHGRIRLMGRWIHFPLKPLDLALRAHPRFKLGVAADMARRILPQRRNGAAPTFASVLRAGLGRTICETFYFPYAWKMWGQGPETLSPIQARKRVSAGSLGRMVRRVLEGARGRKGMRGHFYYPRLGYGQISQAYRDAAERAGARFELGARVTRVELRDAGGAAAVTYARGGATTTIEADHVWSTIPIGVTLRMLDPSPPQDVIDAAARVTFRSMILVYLVLPQEQFTEFDAHYFPERDLPFTRLSEPKNYSVRGTPPNRTVLCAEIPCSAKDAVWTMSDADLGARVAEGLRATGLPLATSPVAVVSKRLEHAYPIYDLGSEERFAELDRYASSRPRLLCFGRLGLFAHDNTHHALHMGYSAADCLRESGAFDADAWAAHRRDFEKHVVED